MIFFRSLRIAYLSIILECCIDTNTREKIKDKIKHHKSILKNK